MANPKNESKNNGQDTQRFQSDTEKLTNRHLADPDHVITDEEFSSVRIGMSPPPDAPTREAIKEADDRIADHKSDKDDDTLPGAQKITPWDVVE
jgi:hypothetical protein